MVLELVRRDSFALLVQPTTTILMLVEVRAGLTACRMASFVRKSGPGADSSTINSRFNLIFPGVMRVAALCLAVLFVVAVIHC